MQGHIHLGLWFIVNVALAMYIINVLARIVAGHLHDSPLGRALAFGF